MGYEGKGLGGTWVNGTTIEKLLLARNLCIGGALQEVRRTLWGLN